VGIDWEQFEVDGKEEPDGRQPLVVGKLVRQTEVDGMPMRE